MAIWLEYTTCGGESRVQIPRKVNGGDREKIGHLFAPVLCLSLPVSWEVQ